MPCNPSLRGKPLVLFVACQALLRSAYRRASNRKALQNQQCNNGNSGARCQPFLPARLLHGQVGAPASLQRKGRKGKLVKGNLATARCLQTLILTSAPMSMHISSNNWKKEISLYFFAPSTACGCTSTLPLLLPHSHHRDTYCRQPQSLPNYPRLGNQHHWELLLALHPSSLLTVTHHHITLPVHPYTYISLYISVVVSPQALHLPSPVRWIGCSPTDSRCLTISSTSLSPCPRPSSLFTTLRP